MNIDATEAELHDTAEAIKLAAILDDRVAKPDKARIAAWAEKIHGHNLERSDLLDGLQAFYDNPSDYPIGIGDLIHHARIIKRARLDREEDADRERRRTEQDDKAADEVRAVTAAAIIGRTKDTPRLIAARDALQTCQGRHESQPAIREYVVAKAEAGSGRHLGPKRKAVA